MNQLAISFTECRVPSEDSQCGVLLRAMKKGERLTVASALTQYGCYALSQRCGELRRMGWPVLSRTVESNGKHFKEYWLA